ncbi:sugar ABC transporter substrate-binding protein [Peribacillus asahii]|uniref:sugar ABC transporter substrate-binding protein n=1 Tax=Peribacillus asahii TaxID=228899 RepID=UPI00207A7B21|nr:sugar ABC transporter substrate-binding protein [Peribacillus asahii]USK71356.1 sugar ABC transporter substrate-binding protein [Peribacillus asahii]
MFNNRKRFLLMIFMISLIVIVFIYKQFGEEKPKVVVVLQSYDLDYWDLIKAGAEKGFEEFGIDGKVIMPKDETVEAQKDLLKKVLKENPDVLVVSPVYSSDSVTSELEKFVKKDIPVLFVYTEDPWEHKTAYIGTNNLDLGKKAGVLMASQLQPGDKVALLRGKRSIVEGQRIRGAKDSLETVRIEIVTEETGLSDSDPELVRKTFEDILREHPDLKGVIASTDYIALPVLKVLKERGMQMPVVGASGTPEMIKLVEDGTLSSAIAQNPYDMGYLSVQTALKVTKGEKVNPNIDSGVDIVTKGNAKERLDLLNSVLE